MDKDLHQIAKAPMIALIEKKNNLKTKTKRTAALLLMLALLLALLAPCVAQAQAQQESLTVYDGNGTDDFIPACIGAFDQFTRSQFVIPADDLTAMAGNAISSMKFYTTTTNIPYTTNCPVDVYLMEVDYTAIGALEPKDNDDIVYQGTLEIVETDNGGELTISFDEAFEYGGGNLLVGIENTSTGTGFHRMIPFYGTHVPYDAAFIGFIITHGYFPISFIPKTTFTYEAANPNCQRPATLTAGSITGHEATLTWSDGSGIYNLETKADGGTWTRVLDNTTDTTYTWENLTPETGYQARVQSVCGDEVSAWRHVGFSTPIVCPAPTGLIDSVNQLTQTNILHWTENGEATTWQICLNDDENNLITTDSNPYDLTGLFHESRFSAKVRAYCNDIDQSPWSNTVNGYSYYRDPVTITADSPFFEGFESPEGCPWNQYCNPVDMPDYWFTLVWGMNLEYDLYPRNSIWVEDAPNYVHSGAQSLVFPNQIADTYVFFPIFSNPINHLQISFWMRTADPWGGQGQLRLGYITAEDNGFSNTFTEIVSYDNSNHNMVRRSTVLDNVPAEAVRLAFLWNGVPEGSDHHCFIDDVEVAIVPLGFCYPLGTLSVGEVTATSAYLSWELIDDSQTAWDVQVATDAAFTAIVAEHVADSHENYLIDNLSAETQYYVRVKAICDDTHQSEWSNAIDFTTLCELIEVTADAPYTQDFESPEGTTTNEPGPLPPCWEAYTDDGIDPHNCTFWGHNSTQSLAFYNNDFAYAILPEFSNPINELQISFWMRADMGGTLLLGYLTAEDDGTCNSFTSIANYGDNGGNAIQRSTVLDNVPAEAERLVFRWFGRTNVFPRCFIDDVVVSINPEMIQPHDIAVGNITPHTADITWDGYCDSYALRYKVATETSWTTPDDATALADHSHTLTGLTPETTYEVQVQGTYDSTVFDWSESVTFTTYETCPVPFNMAASSLTVTTATLAWTGFSDSYNVQYRTKEQNPFSEDFEGEDVIAPGNWTFISGNTANGIGGNGTCPARIYAYGDDGDYTPVHGGEKAFRFSSYTQINSEETYDQYLVSPELSVTGALKFYHRKFSNSSENLQVGYSTTTNDVETEGVFTWSNVDLSTSWQEYTLALPADVKYFAFHYYGYRYFVYVDDISIGEWIPAGEWESVEGISGLGTTLGGLQPGTPYEWQVQGICEGAATEWSASAYLTTLECEIPADLTVSGLTATSAALAWTGSNDSYNVQYRTAAQDSFSEDFEGEDVIAPGNWTFISGNTANGIGGNGTYTARIYAYGDDGDYTPVHGGEKAFRFSSYTQINSEETYDQYLVSPELSVTGALKFYHRKYNSFTENLQVGYSTTTNDVETEGVFTWSNVDLSTSWQEYTLALPADVKYIAFHYYGDCSYMVYLDDISIGEWIPAGEWELVEGISGLGTTLSGLLPSTLYEWQVQGICEGAATEWSASAYFTTMECEIPADLTVSGLTATSAALAWTGSNDSYNVQYRTKEQNPLSEDFEGEDVIAPGNWTFISMNAANAIGTSTGAGRLAAAAHSGSYGFRFSSYSRKSDGETYDQYLVSPELTLTGELSFYFKKTHTSTETLYFGYSTTTNDLEAFTWTGDLAPTQSWQQYTQDLPTDVKYIAFHYFGDYLYYVYVDDIVINIPAGEWETVSTTEMNVTLTGLTPNTLYEAQVKGNCGEDGESRWSESAYFTTEEGTTLTKDITGYGNGNGGWYLIASPVMEAVTPRAENGFLTSAFDLYRFNQSEELEWENWKAQGEHYHFNLESGRGYLYASQENTTLLFAGTPHPTTGPVEVPLAYDPAASFAGWNLVGNPFAQAAYVDRDFYVMNTEGDEIQAAERNYVEPMEGIFVVATGEGETMTFSTTDPNQAKGRIVLNVTSDNRGEVIDRAIVRFGQGDRLPKFMLNQGNTKLYIEKDGEDYAVVRGGTYEKLPVNFEAAQKGTYTLTVSPRDLLVSFLQIIDKQMGITVNLLRTPSYTFDATPFDRPDRFELAFRTTKLQFKEVTTVFGFNNNGRWVISNEGDAILQVVDVNGRILSSEEIHGNCTKHIKAAPGVYVLRLINGEDVKVQKIVVE